MKLVILDRDGVINKDSDEYVKSPEEWVALPGSLEAIAKLKECGYTIALATNQSGVGRGYFSHETLHAIHDKMQSELQALGGCIDAIFYCPHHPDENCDCRKPKPGLLHQIQTHFQCALKGVPFIGDSMRDMEAGIAADCQAVLVKTGRGMNAFQRAQHNTKILVFNDLSAVATILCQQ